MTTNDVSSAVLLIRFVAVFFVLFFLSAAALYIIDFVPEKPTENSSAHADGERGNDSLSVPEQPTRIVINAAGVDVDIQNPVSSSIETLDQALLDGAVRYPGSAKLGETGTVYLFGHQSYLPVVKNRNFKAFNGLQKLKDGDTITVYSDTAAYTYAVKSVSLVEASDALIPLSSGDKSLFLSTCNSFGDPGERYVVEATYLSHETIN